MRLPSFVTDVEAGGEVATDIQFEIIEEPSICILINLSAVMHKKAVYDKLELLNAEF